MKDIIKGYLDDNLARVESLVATYESHPAAKGSGRKGTEVLDILRAAAVLLHASLEDVLRRVASWKLPLAPKSVLDEIALAGANPLSKKFTLGDLATHRGVSVEALITSSVESHLERSNYNNTKEIAALLESVGVDVRKVSGRFANLAKLMERRHQIVHRADRKDHVSGSGDHAVRAINKGTVRGWADDVKAFVDDLLAQL
jgi:RiboL-PSP-HEPN